MNDTPDIDLHLHESTTGCLSKSVRNFGKMKEEFRRYRGLILQRFGDFKNLPDDLTVRIRSDGKIHRIANPIYVYHMMIQKKCIIQCG
jgi:hypothetical protein